MVNDVGDAARLTLRSGSARVARWMTLEPPGEVILRDTGLVDFVTVRTSVRSDAVEPIEAIKTVVRVWPWLVGELGGSDHRTVYSGNEVFRSDEDGEQWWALGEGDPAAPRRHHDDPLWIVEMLQGVEDPAVATGPPEPGSTAWEFRLSALAPPLTGTAWVDGDGRIRRVRWREVVLRRPRALAGPPQRVVWNHVELSDYGVPVTIDLPAAERDRTPWPVDLARFGLQLWRRKRDYERRGGGEAPPA